jgi:hypothetical protein
LNASMLVFHLPISRFLSYGITPRPMAGPVGRQVTAPGISELLHTWGERAEPVGRAKPYKIS